MPSKKTVNWGGGWGRGENWTSRRNEDRAKIQCDRLAGLSAVQCGEE